MVDREMTKSEFAEVAHSSVQGVAGLYDQVGLLLGELREFMAGSFQPLIGRRPVRAHHHDYKRAGKASMVKRLAPWYGFLFVPVEGELEPDVGDVDDESDVDADAEPKGVIELRHGQRFLYAKAIIYSPFRNRPVEPALLTGLTEVTASLDALKQGQFIKMKRKGTRHLLDVITHELDAAEPARRPKVRGKRESRR